MSKRKGKGKGNSWKPGAIVSIGGRQYKVLRQEVKPGKPWVIQTLDGSRTYEWRAFHGLTLTSGQPLIRQRARHRQATAADNGLLGLIIEDIRQHPRDGSGEFLAKVLPHFGISLPSQPQGGGGPGPDGQGPTEGGPKA